MVTDRVGDPFYTSPVCYSEVGCMLPYQVLYFFLLCMYPWRIVVCDPHLTEAGSHDTYLILRFVLTQHCFLGLSLLKYICIVHLCILMLRLHPPAWLHHNDLSIRLSMDFILQPEAFVSTYSWGHMITFSAVQAQKWGSWATGYVNFEIHSIFAYFF